MAPLSKVVTSLLLAMTVSTSLGQTLTGSTADGTVVKVDSTLTIKDEANKPTKWIPQLEDENPPLMLFQGFTLSVDLLGAGMGILTDYGNYEAALRLSLKNTFFPIAELGFGKCKSLDDNTSIAYETSAPYLRIGLDYNILKDKYQDNRLFVGLRYGFSSFKYDFSGPSITDPIWGGSSDLNLRDVSCTSHWLEVCFGCQVKVWSSFHMGWSIRYKSEISSTNNDACKPHYIPGYGTTSSGSCWGGTYNLIFDLNWGKKKIKNPS